MAATTARPATTAATPMRARGRERVALSGAMPEPDDRLPGREESVLALVAGGPTNAEIGEHLFVSPSTVKSHLAGLQTKPGARNRVELAAWAWRSGRMADPG